MTGGLDFRREQHGVAIAIVGGMAFTILVLGIAISIDLENAALPLATRLQLTLKAQLFLGLWLAAAIANVARIRFASEKDISGSASPKETGHVRRAQAVLQNTLEQTILAILAHLSLAATFERSHAVIIAMVGLFLIGRLLFWVGYEHGARRRALGFALTFYPSLIALLGCLLAMSFGMGN